MNGNSMQLKIPKMKKYRIVIKSGGRIINDSYVDKISDVDLSDSPMNNVTIMGSSKSIKQIQKSQNSLTRKSMSKFSKLRTKLVYE